MPLIRHYAVLKGRPAIAQGEALAEPWEMSKKQTPAL